MKLKRTISVMVLLMPCVMTINRSAAGAEFDVETSITVREEYNDNIFLDSEDPVEEYISRVIPSLDIAYRSPLWDWKVDYAYEYRHYANESVDDESIHTVDANMDMELIGDFLFLHASDEYSRVSLDATRDFARESLFVNQSDRNVLNLNPYMRMRAGSHIGITAGYIYSDVWYEEETAVDTADNTAYADIEYGAGGRASLQAGYRHTSENSDATDFERNSAYAGMSYEYAEESRVFARAGRTYVKFEGRETSSHAFWNAGVTHRFPYFSSTLQSSYDYDENPAGAPLRVAAHRLSFNSSFEGAVQRVAFSYVEYKDSLTDAFVTRRYGVEGALSYEVTRRLTGDLDFTAEVLEDVPEDTYTRGYLFGIRFEYALGKRIFIALSDKYSDYYSPDVKADNFNNHRLEFEVRKTF